MEAGNPFEFVHGKHQVAFDGAALFVDGRRFGLDDIERLGTSVTVDQSQGRWNRLTAGVSVFGNDEVASVQFVGDAGTERWGEWRPLWDQLDTVVRARIQPRLLQRTLTTVTNGGEVDLGCIGPRMRGRFTVSLAGIRHRKPFARPMAWTSISGVTVRNGILVIGLTDPRPREYLTGLGVGEWDAWQLPVLVERLG
jgi:hypothetical protein